MKVTIWGTRGSFPTSQLGVSRYGGNTTCIEVRTDAGDIIILDAGSGIRELGKHLLTTNNKGECAVFLTHKHWDHVHGLTSFQPLYVGDWHVSVYGPQYGTGIWQQTLEILFDGSHFPLAWENIGDKHSIKDFTAGDSFHVGSAYIETCATCHKGGCVAYKITADNWTFFFSGDHEWGIEDTEQQEVLEVFMGTANVILADAFFNVDDYPMHKGWGHSTMEQWIEHTLHTKVKRLIFTHYHPDYTDDVLEAYIDNIWRLYPELSLELALAYEGMCIQADKACNSQADVVVKVSCPMCDFSRKVSRYADPALVLEGILTEARRIGHADAGTVYLVSEEGVLTFSYAQNMSIYPNSNETPYLNATIPMTKNSIVGYVASTAKPLSIADVRCLSDSVPYKFNDVFDRDSGYTTVSMMTVPLIDNSNEIVGVLQLINSLDEGKPQPFTLSMQKKLMQLAETASDFIERSHITNALIMRMLETAALRDPTETAGHVMRVGTMTAEIYHRWAEKNKICPEELRTVKDRIRLAAMLHDVGKVGIPDMILKKQGQLSDEEFAVIQKHAAMGAGLFKDATSQLDIMARNIALHHHQKWNGKGYTGDPNQPILSGTDIPLEARITAIADVYDALVSVRCYKSAVPPETAWKILQKDAGSHFDPELIEVVLEIKDMIQGIYKRFSD